MSTHTDRSGLYVMVFLTLLNSCSASDDAAKIRKEVERINSVIGLPPIKAESK